VTFHWEISPENPDELSKLYRSFIANRFSAEKSHVIYRHSIDPSESPLSSSTTTPKRINGKQSKQNGLLFFLIFLSV
jgi:hypothetical protein